MDVRGGEKHLHDGDDYPGQELHDDYDDGDDVDGVLYSFLREWARLTSQPRLQFSPPSKPLLSLS